MAGMTFESGLRLAEAHWPNETILSDPLYSRLTSYRDGLPVHLYCPACLANDEVPYIRRQWRRVYQLVCPTHVELLHDSCPHCRKRINYSRFVDDRPKTNIETYFRLCPSCGFDLARATRIAPDPPMATLLLNAQKLLNSLATSAFYRHPTAGTVSSAKILQSFLIAKYQGGSTDPTIDDYLGINWRRLFLNHYDEVILTLRRARRALVRSPGSYSKPRIVGK
jgi:hypothetical protein